MKLESKTGALCRSLGYSEIITYSFVSPSIFDKIRIPADSPLRNTLKIQNPLGEDTSVMRTTALPSMLDIISRNYAYHNKNVKLYELAKVYLPSSKNTLPTEPKFLMLGAYGGNTNFFTIKGELESILSGLNMPKTRYIADSTNSSYHPGRCAKVSVNGADIGYIGQIHPLTAQNYGIDCEVYCAQINFTKLAQYLLPEATYGPLPKYPSVIRDLAVVCDETITVAELEDVIASAAGKLLRSIKLFDIYRGTGIAEDKKSMAFNLELRANDRTMNEADCETVINNVLTALKEKLGAVLR